MLGAHAPWLDKEDGEADVPVHDQNDSAVTLAASRGLVRRLKELRSSGLSSFAAFQVLLTSCGDLSAPDYPYIIKAFCLFVVHE